MVEFFWIYIWPVVVIAFFSIILLVGLLVAIAFLLYADRKIWAAVQIRKGPNVVGPFGVLQSFADLLKFVFKEVVIPSGTNKVIFILAPIVTSVLALSGWAVIPFDLGWVISDLNVGILFILAFSSLEVYGVLMGGWASNNKYSLLGGLRSAAQMISYELSIGFVIIVVLLFAQSLNLTEIVLAQKGEYGLLNWYFIPLFPLFVIYFISLLAETNRPPFDLPEAESELVAGFMTEYSSTPYLLFMLGEYVAIVLLCALATIMFFGGWLPPVDIVPFNMIPGIIWFIIKICFMFFLVAMVKAFVPRYRYDQLMRLGWKVFLPITLFAVVFYATVLQIVR